MTCFVRGFPKRALGVEFRGLELGVRHDHHTSRQEKQYYDDRKGP